MIYLGVAVLAIVLLWAMSQKDPFWHDDNEVRGRILHTVRVPTNFERIAMWRVRSALVAELGDEFTPVTPAIHRHLIPW